MKSFKDLLNMDLPSKRNESLIIESGEISNDVLLEIDPSIRDIIKLLNKKGYKTFTSCEGHIRKFKEEEPPMDCPAHIGFTNRKLADTVNPPNGWVWEIVDGPEKYKDIFRDKCFLYPIDMETILSEDQKEHEKRFSEYKENYIKSLNTWASNLPEYK